MNIYILIGIGGMIGAVLRYSVSILTVLWWSGSFPVATLLANYIGCFLLPFLSFKLSGVVSTDVQKAITTGVIGSFTTFSAFSIETIALFESGNIFEGWLYLFLSIIGGLVFVRLGDRKGRLI
ncbi:fluoride efflux transporter CrcB [Domibacillus aminovorans]|nr:fluoride efflux transporter CrcB [Domibacillus aminovorans]